MIKPVYYILVGQHPFNGLPHKHPMDHLKRFQDLVMSIMQDECCLWSCGKSSWRSQHLDTHKETIKPRSQIRKYWITSEESRPKETKMEVRSSMESYGHARQRLINQPKKPHFPSHMESKWSFQLKPRYQVHAEHCILQTTNLTKKC